MRGRPAFFYLVVVLGALVFGFQVLTWVWLYRFGTLKRDYGWGAADSDVRRISRITPGGPADGKLKMGDQLLAIDGDDRVQRGPLFLGTITLKMSTIPLRDGLYTMKVRRGSEVLEFTFRTAVSSAPHRLWSILPESIAALIYLLCAMLVGLLRPDQKITRLAGLLCFGGAAGLAGFTGFALREFLSGYEILLYHVAMGLLLPGFAVGYDFYHRFPPGVIPGRRFSRIRYLFYPVGFLLFAYFCVMGLVAANPSAGMQVFYDHFQVFNAFWNFNATYWLLSFLAILIVLTRNYRHVQDRDQRIRMKWIYAGVYSALIPGFLFALFYVLSTLLGSVLLPNQVMSALFAFSASIVGLFPITLSYAVLKYKMMDVSVVVRRGLQYLLARNLLWFLLLLPAAGVLWNILSNPNRTLADLVLRNSSYFYILLIASFGLIWRKRLTSWIDRRFFREAYNSEQILLHLVDRVRAVDSLSEVPLLVHEQVEAAFHPRDIAFYFRRQKKEDFELDYSSGANNMEAKLQAQSELLQLAEKHVDPVPFGQDGPLVVPVRETGGRLMAVLLLQGKKSEEPYSAEDRRLLKTVAQQIGIVYENANLKDRMSQEERVRKEVLDRLEGRDIHPLRQCPVCGRCYDSTETACMDDSAELQLSLPVERMIDGKYRLERMLGKGGMGAVYEASDLRLNRKVAVKILLSNMFGNPIALRRFEREAQTSARLSHPNIVAVHDFGSLSSEGAYLVLELLKGLPMRSRLQQPVHPAEIADWFRQLLDGLSAAHHEGIIHRDLKPENVFLTSTGHVKILDFGLAKIRLPDSADTGSLTAPGTVLGTLCYMSPEQLAGQELDERSDIFSVGVMVAEAISGRRPFDGRTPTELVAMILHSEFHLPDDAAELNRVLQRCLAKDRAHRYRSVAELQEDLIPAIRNTPPRAPVSRAGANGLSAIDTLES